MVTVLAILSVLVTQGLSCKLSLMFYPSFTICPVSPVSVWGIPGQVFKQCVDCPGNPFTCSSPQHACNKMCLPGWECPSGWLLDEKANKCVTTCTASSVPKCPIPGQVFKQCVNCPGKPFTCSSPDHACNKMCLPGCECPYGWLLDQITNTCVKDQLHCAVNIYEPFGSYL